jgi:hypothetical protein
MRVTKCDLCKRTIKTTPLQVGFGFYRTEICKFCGESLVNSLISMDVLTDEIKNNKYQINKKVEPASAVSN